MNLQHLLLHLLMGWEMTIFLFLSCHYRQHHTGQRLRGDDADWLWSNGHQDPPHQVLHHPTFAQGQSNRHVLPALPKWQPGHTSCRGANGVCLRSPAAPVLFRIRQHNPWRQTEHGASVNSFWCNKVYLRSSVLPLTSSLWFRFWKEFSHYNTKVAQPHSSLGRISGDSV